MNPIPRFTPDVESMQLKVLAGWACIMAFNAYLIGVVYQGLVEMNEATIIIFASIAVTLGFLELSATAVMLYRLTHSSPEPDAKRVIKFLGLPCHYWCDEGVKISVCMAVAMVAAAGGFSIAHGIIFPATWLLLCLFMIGQVWWFKDNLAYFPS